MNFLFDNYKIRFILNCKFINKVWYRLIQTTSIMKDN